MPFQQLTWDAAVADDCRQLIRLAVREDLQRTLDVTTLSLVDGEDGAQATVVSREPGIAAGMPAVGLIMEEMNIPVTQSLHAADGQRIEAGTPLVTIAGKARDLLTAERTLLNFLGRLCGVATLTQQYVAAVGDAPAKVYDTRKTTPGWRRLEKYAVRCGGGCNHRTGLFDAVLIKDNHLAQLSSRKTPAEAVQIAREFVKTQELGTLPIEVEVDTLEQLATVLPVEPDIVLLDNMSPQQLREAVQLRDQANSRTELEASGGINLQTIAEVAATGVERISVGALTHSARSLDVGLDWQIG